MEILNQAPCYPGVAFRLEDPGDFEVTHAVPVVSGLWDARQFHPAFNVSTRWQLYHGPAHPTTAAVPTGEWFTLRADVVGERAAVRLGDQPPPVAERLARGQ